ncbi:MAG: hypothetical protein ACYDAY_03980 [Candidatus Dormibacteria bacterium]
MRSGSISAKRAGVVLVTLAVGLLAGSPAGAAPVSRSHLHAMAGPGAPASSPQDMSNNLIYHGGAVLTSPKAYTIFWGPQWMAGFCTQGTWCQDSVENYVNTFFAEIGGTPYAGVQTQYCMGTLPGMDCASQTSPAYVTNPLNQFAGTWVDTSVVPSPIVTTGLAENTTSDPLETEAIAAAAHFGYDQNAVYFIFTPPGIKATGYNVGGVYCGYHSETMHTTGHGVRYAFIPYVPEQGCGMNAVNAANDAFGHGVFDGYSIVLGHEYEEAVTDPDNENGVQDGWNDVQTNENGDKCAWKDLADIVFRSHSFAVQPLWSNEAAGGAGACAMHR